MKRQFTLFRMLAAISWLVLFAFVALNYEIEFSVDYARPDDLFAERCVHFRMERQQEISPTVFCHTVDCLFHEPMDEAGEEDPFGGPPPWQPVSAGHTSVLPGSDEPRIAPEQRSAR